MSKNREREKHWPEGGEELRDQLFFSPASGATDHAVKPAPGSAACTGPSLIKMLLLPALLALCGLAVSQESPSKISPDYLITEPSSRISGQQREAAYDLLQEFGLSESQGVKRVAGSEPETMAYRINPSIHLKKSSSDVYPSGLPSDYSVVATFKQSSDSAKTSWNLWQVSDPEGQDQVGLQLQGDSRTLDFFYTSPLGTKTLRSFQRVDKLFDGEWHKLALSVKGGQVKLLVDCEEISVEPLDEPQPVIRRGFTTIVKRAAGDRSVLVDLQKMDISCDADQALSEGCCELSSVCGGYAEIGLSAGRGKASCKCVHGQPGVQGRPGPKVAESHSTLSTHGILQKTNTASIFHRVIEDCRGKLGSQAELGTGLESICPMDCKQRRPAEGYRLHFPHKPQLCAVHLLLRVVSFYRKTLLETSLGAVDERGETMGRRGNTGDYGPLGETGPKGEQGIKGEKGMRGLWGEEGDRGPKGLKGLKGASGHKGVRGSPGDWGETGQTGEVGAAGEPGYEGIAGYQGVKGSEGLLGAEGSRGPRGNQGVVGDPGERGAAGEKGKPGYQGPKGKVGGIGGKGIVGDPGLPGRDGDVGIEAHQGPQGPEGKRGQNGERGEKGEQGPPGNMGPPGITGHQGYKGSAGKPGRPGFIGPPGITGHIGVPGKAGPKGDTGSQGVLGSKGEKGEKGVKGPKGRTGEVGVLGQQGSRGKRGPVGEQGKKGTVGSKGVRGDGGPVGFQGPPGPPGPALAAQHVIDVCKRVVLEQMSTFANSVKRTCAAVCPLYGDVPMGAPGPPGPKGPPGPPGEAGINGVKGEMGQQGFYGEPGDPGRRGSTGKTIPRLYMQHLDATSTKVVLQDCSFTSRFLDISRCRHIEVFAFGNQSHNLSSALSTTEQQKSVFEHFVFFSGDRGEQGDKGAKGYGLPGYIGEQGPQGQRGRPGRAFDGTPGRIGERGHVGQPGVRGHPGLPGVPGVCLTSGCALLNASANRQQPQSPQVPEVQLGGRQTLQRPPKRQSQRNRGRQ
ncbi:hypothetical protein DNTS_014056 [Danionella cerebrum]|uniref:Thrombospondin-like N-terminal domain-containing protein n=1 Tax=Danionella cerebrum TaxID=2873325 RepID=A0A553NIH1_9TELE|nr:hypothetical protein DNTS_014056 [Danionella translucida]